MGGVQKTLKKPLTVCSARYITYVMKAKKEKTMAEILRETAFADGRSIWQLARDADIHYPVMYLFMKGDKTGRKRKITIETADKLARALRLELKPKKKGR